MADIVLWNYQWEIILIQKSDTPCTREFIAEEDAKQPSTVYVIGIASKLVSALPAM